MRLKQNPQRQISLPHFENAFLRLDSTAMLLSRLLPLLGVATAFQVLIEDADETRQVCSGMFGPRGDESASIEGH